MNKSKIEWCDYTFNPVTGCLHGCEYCYSKVFIQRFSGRWDKESLRTKGGNSELHDLEKPMSRHTNGKNRDRPVHSVQAPFPYGFDPTFHRYRLDEPQKVKKPQNIFVCSMADLFGEWVPDEWIQQVFEACEKAPQHRYIFLSKNPRRYGELYDKKLLPVSNKYWFGVTKTIDDTKFIWSVPYRWFVSIEPIMGSFSMASFERVKWAIIGQETGTRKGKVIPKREWIENIVNECRKQNVPVFLKNNLSSVWGEPLIQEYPW